MYWCDWAINIFVYGMETHVLSFFQYSESLFTADRFYMQFNPSLMSIGDVTCIILKKTASASAYDIKSK